MLEFGGGLTGRINANVSVFANVDCEFAVGSGDDKRNGVRGALGADIPGDAPLSGAHIGKARWPLWIVIHLSSVISSLRNARPHDRSRCS